MASILSEYLKSGKIKPKAIPRSNAGLVEYEGQIASNYPDRKIKPAKPTPPTVSDTVDTGYGKYVDNFKNGEILKGLKNLGIDVLGAPADVLYNTALQGQSILSGNGFRSPSQYVGRMGQKEYEDELKRMGVIDQTTYEKIDNPYARDLYLSAMTIGSDPLNALDVGAAQIARNIGRQGSSIYARELARGNMPKNTTQTVKTVEGYLDSNGRQKTRTVKKEVLPQAGNSTLTHVGDKAQVNAPYATTLRRAGNAVNDIPRANTIVPEVTETVSDARNIASGTPIPVNPNKRVSRSFNIVDDLGQTATKNFDGYEYRIGDRTFLVSGKGKKWNVIDESGNTIGDTYRTRNEASQNLERLANDNPLNVNEIPTSRVDNVAEEVETVANDVENVVNDVETAANDVATPNVTEEVASDIQDATSDINGVIDELPETRKNGEQRNFVYRFGRADQNNTKVGTGYTYYVDTPNNSYSFVVDKRNDGWHITDWNTGLAIDNKTYKTRQAAIDDMQRLAKQIDDFRNKNGRQYEGLSGIMADLRRANPMESATPPKTPKPKVNPDEPRPIPMKGKKTSFDTVMKNNETGEISIKKRDGIGYTYSTPNNTYTFFVDKRGEGRNAYWIVTDGNTGMTVGTKAYNTRKEAIADFEKIGGLLDEIRATGNPVYDDGVSMLNDLREGKTVSPKTPKKIPPKKNINGEARDLGADINKTGTLDEYVERYGEQKKGSGVPNATPYGDVGTHIGTIVEGEVYPKETIDELLKLVEQGDATKTTVRNEAARNDAKSLIERDLKDAENKFGAAASGERKTTSHDIVLGYELAMHYSKLGKYDKAAEILNDVNLMESELGRGLQAARMVSKNTPEGRLRLVQKIANRLSDMTGSDVTIEKIENTGLLEQLAKEDLTEQEAIKILKEIRKDLWKQIPPTFKDKFNAWRYLAMLGNPKTILRNEIGNGAMYLVRQAKDALAGSIEDYLVRTGKMNEYERSHTFLNPVKDKELIDYAKSLAGERIEDIRGADKWADITDMNRPQELAIFGQNDDVISRTLGKGVEKWRSTTNKALNEGFDNKFLNTFVKGDAGWIRKNYSDAFAKIMKARGLTIKQLENNPELIEQLHELAKQEALRATFRDASKAAEAISKSSMWLRRQDNIALKGAGYGIEGLVPFKRTPINIMRRSFDYSPAGALKSAFTFSKTAEKYGLDTAIDRLAAGLTGTGITALGMYLASQGIVRVHMPDKEKESDLARAQGQQSFSIEVGGKSYTLDWLAPAAVPFFLGASIYEALQSEAEVSELIDSIAAIGDPIFEMTMLQGIQSLFLNNETYGNDDVATKALSKGIGIGGSLVGQTIPTVFGQAARTIDPSGYRTNATSVRGTIPNAIAYNLNRNVVSKIPFANQTRAENVDVWGRTQTKDSMSDYVLSGLENFFSAGYANDLNTTPVDSEVLRLYDMTGKSTALPSQEKVTIKYNGTDYRMTQKERAEVQKTRGRLSYEGIEKLINSPEYASMTDEEKAKAVENVYENAKKEAEKEYLINKGVTSELDYDIGQLSESNQKLVGDFSNSMPKEQAYDIINTASGYDTKTAKMLAIFGNGADATTRDVLRETTSKDYSLNSDMEYNVALLLSRGLDADDFEEANDGVKSMFGGGNISAEEAVRYLETTPYSREQKYALLRALTGVKTDKKNPYA